MFSQAAVEKTETMDEAIQKVLPTCFCYDCCLCISYDCGLCVSYDRGRVCLAIAACVPLMMAACVLRRIVSTRASGRRHSLRSRLHLGDKRRRSCIGLLLARLLWLLLVQPNMCLCRCPRIFFGKVLPTIMTSHAGGARLLTSLVRSVGSALCLHRKGMWSMTCRPPISTSALDSCLRVSYDYGLCVSYDCGLRN